MDHWWPRGPRVELSKQEAPGSGSARVLRFFADARQRAGNGTTRETLCAQPMRSRSTWTGGFPITEPVAAYIYFLFYDVVFYC